VSFAHIELELHGREQPAQVVPCNQPLLVRRDLRVLHHSDSRKQGRCSPFPDYVAGALSGGQQRWACRSCRTPPQCRQHAGAPWRAHATTALAQLDPLERDPPCCHYSWRSFEILSAVADVHRFPAALDQARSCRPRPAPAGTCRSCPPSPGSCGRTSKRPLQAPVDQPDLRRDQSARGRAQLPARAELARLRT
jgi:hypothetical protein